MNANKVSTARVTFDASQTLGENLRRLCEAYRTTERKFNEYRCSLIASATFCAVEMVERLKPTDGKADDKLSKGLERAWDELVSLGAAEVVFGGNKATDVTRALFHHRKRHAERFAPGGVWTPSSEVDPEVQAFDYACELSHVNGLSHVQTRLIKRMERGLPVPTRWAKDAEIAFEKLGERLKREAKARQDACEQIRQVGADDIGVKAAGGVISAARDFCRRAAKSMALPEAQELIVKMLTAEYQSAKSN